jgi:hypothetical protein
MIFANNNRNKNKISQKPKKGSDRKIDKWRQYDEKDRYTGVLDNP